MSKEAMKLALEALENSIDLVSHEARNAEELYGKYPTRLARIQGLVAFEVAHEKAIAALRQALANEALDKKAENARELGLDYEPAQRDIRNATLDEIANKINADWPRSDTAASFAIWIREMKT